ncbi:MAG: hypothetical protein L3K19_03745 [Thermoplasmata archaeon]|nr:hypothetical protein [Thermoplasmata archaeon]
MSSIPERSVTRYAKLAAQLTGGKSGESPLRAGFGPGAMFVGRKMFGVLDESGALVIKLPPARVQELIAKGVGAPWHPGAGAPLKEYIAIGFDKQARWLGLAKESREYMRS